MTAPKIGERHRECAAEISRDFRLEMTRDTEMGLRTFKTGRHDIAPIIAKHFQEDERPVDVVSAAERIQREHDLTGPLSIPRLIEIINGCRR